MAHRQTRPGTRRVGSTGALLGTLIAATLAQAGDLNGKVPLDIPQQSLSSALTALAKQADLQILFSQELVAGLRSNAISGSLSGAEALQRLLADSTLEYVVNGTDTVVIRQRRQTDAPKPVSQLTRTGETAAAEPGSSEGGGLQEIIVTAQKRAERLQDVPVAVTALSGETLSRNNVNDTTGLVAMTPSLTFTDGAQPNNRNFRIRGIGTAVFGQGLEPSVSVVMDGIPLARASQGFSDLSDIERVEVLRGPQGTLFGKNSVGGVINVVTRRPSKEFQANADATFAEDQEYRVRGSISGPLTDGLGGRLTAYYNDIGGFIRNLTRGEDTNGQKSMGFRGKLDWDATDRLNLLFMGDYRKNEADCCSSQYLVVNNPLLTQLISPIVANWNNRAEVENDLTWADTQQTTFSLEANLNLDAVSFTSITAYQDFSLQNNQPIDRLNTPTPIYLPATNGYFDINGGTVDLTQWTQELRVANASGGRFNYVAGVFLLDLDLDRTFQRRSGNCAPGAGTPAAFGQPCIIPQYRSQAGFLSNTGTRNYALFGQTDFNLGGNLSAVLGARAQYERVSYQGTRADVRLVPGDLPLVGVTPSTGSGHSHDSVVTGKAGFKYEFSENAQTYLTWSTGYKGAGYETEFGADFANQAPVQPEKAKAWELGYKARLLNGSLVLNTALFHAKYDDLQVQANRGDASIGLVRFVTTNAGNSVTQGAEIELTAEPFRGFTLNGGVTYLETSVDADGLSCALSLQAAAPVIAGLAPDNTCYRTTAGATPVQNIRDGVLPNAPKWRGNLSARYEFALPGTQYTSFVQLSSVSQSKINFVIEQDPLTVQPAYTTVDASFGFNSPNDRYRVTFFARNLFDRHYVSLLARSSTLSTATLTPNQLTGNIPKEANRYFGATIGVSF